MLVANPFPSSDMSNCVHGHHATPGRQREPNKWARLGVCGGEDATLGKPLHHHAATVCCSPQTLTALPSPIRSFPLTPRLHMHSILTLSVRLCPSLRPCSPVPSTLQRRRAALSRHQLETPIGRDFGYHDPRGSSYSGSLSRTATLGRATRSNHDCPGVFAQGMAAYRTTPLPFMECLARSGV